MLSSFFCIFYAFFRLVITFCFVCKLVVVICLLLLCFIYIIPLRWLWLKWILIVLLYIKDFILFLFCIFLWAFGWIHSKMWPSMLLRTINHRPFFKTKFTDPPPYRTCMYVWGGQITEKGPVTVCVCVCLCMGVSVYYSYHYYLLRDYKTIYKI